jgi:carbon monoxide dehydrogenase subunit G
MLTVERTVRTATPIDRVFAYLSDFTHTEEWDPGTVRTTRIDDGPIVVGSRFRNVSKFRGRETELEYRLARLEPDQRLTFVGENKTVTSTDDLTFTATDSGTSIHYRAQFDFKGIAKLVSPFLRSTIEKLADQTVQKMSGALAQLGAQP